MYLMKGINIIRLKEREAGDSLVALNTKIVCHYFFWTTN